MLMPESPYPKGLNWRQRSAWRRANKDKWNAYRKAWRDAWNTAKFYVPFNQEKCDALDGKKSRYMKIPYRYGRVKEYRACPKKYPPKPSPTPDNNETVQIQAMDIYGTGDCMDP